MASIVSWIKSFLVEEDGVTAIEYGLIAALVAVFIIAALNLLGGSLSDIFTYVSEELDAAQGSGEGT